MTLTAVYLNLLLESLHMLAVGLMVQIQIYK